MMARVRIRDAGGRDAHAAQAEANVNGEVTVAPFAGDRKYTIAPAGRGRGSGSAAGAGAAGPERGSAPG